MDALLSADDVDVAVDILVGKLQTQGTSGRINNDIDRFDKHVECLRVVMDAVQRRLQVRIAQSRPQRNALTFIHRLPTELLATIFQFAMDSPSSSDHFRRLAKISGVSSVWRAIVNASPGLWAVICSTNDWSLIELALERSGCCPLEVICSGEDAASWAVAKPLDEERTRVRSLELHLSPDGKAFGHFTDGPALALETLILVTTSTTFDREVGVDIFGGQAPKLRDITIRGLSVRWDSTIFIGLKSLELCNLTNGAPSANRMLCILRQAPELAQLTLQTVIFSIDISLEPNTSPISLSSLQLLRLLCLTTTDMLLLADSITAPSCREIEIYCMDVGDPYYDSLPVASIASLGLPLKDIMASIETLAIWIDEDTFQCVSTRPMRGEDHVGLLDLVLPIDNARYLVQWLANSMPQPSDANAPDVEITIGSDNIADNPAILGILGRMRVTELNLETTANTNPFIRYLATSTIVNSSTRQWNLPYLHTLLIDGIFDKFLLVDMLEKRYGRRLKRKGRKGKHTKDSKAGRPLPLASLTFRGLSTIDMETFEEVQKILGPGVATWEEEMEEVGDGEICSDFDYE